MNPKFRKIYNLINSNINVNNLDEDIGQTNL